MTTAIWIGVGELELPAELNDSAIARAVAEVLPLEASVRTWGDEIYFPVPVERELDATAQEVVTVGDLGYWPAGRAFCVFFGPTPVSRGDEIRPASAVNVIGRVTIDARVLKGVGDGERVRLRLR